MFSHNFSVHSSGGIDIVDITDKVEKIVRESKAKEGMCFVFTTHTTACLTMNENESGLLNDIKETLEKIAPRSGSYRHNRGGEGNANAHIISSIIKPYLVIPVENGSLKTGTWQNLFLVDLDGPRTRNVNVQIFS
jgi:secondary thiamine-phosphate synthase enzyme